MRSREGRPSARAGKVGTKAPEPAPPYAIPSGESRHGVEPGLQPELQPLGNPAPEPASPVGDRSGRQFVVDGSRCGLHGKDPAKERARTRLRRRHAERIARGRCTRCGKVAPEPGLKMCRRCGEKRRAADQARRARARANGVPYGGRDPALRRRSDQGGDKRRRQARHDAGLCTSCGRHPSPDDGSVCESCRTLRRAFDQQRYQSRGISM